MRLYHFKRLFLFNLAIVIISGCNKEVVPITTLIPAEMIIPHEIESISIFPVAGMPEAFGSFKGMTHFPLGKKINYNVARLGYVYGLYDVFADSPRFRRVVISDSTYMDSLIAGKMNFHHVKEICRNDSTDALVLIKLIQVSDYFDADYINQGQYSIFVDLMVGIYEPSLPKGGMVFRFYDKLYYYSYKRLLPQKTFEILSDMFYFSGINLGEYMVPHWQDGEHRMLLKGLGTEMKMAAKIASRGEWDEAAEIWNEHSLKRGKKVAAKASFNMAVAWEQADSLEQAWIWIDHADILSNRNAIDQYKSVLKERINNKAKIDAQMPEY